MSNQDEIKKLAGEISALGEGFMRDTEERNKAVPFVQKTIEFSQQFQNTFEAIPHSFQELDWNCVYEPLKQSRDYLASIPNGIGALPAAVSGAAMSNSAGTAVVTMLLNTTPDSDANAKAWVNRNVGCFERLQVEQTNIDFIRRKLATLRPGSEIEFDQALEEYSRAISGVADSKGATLKFRNVLESLNGSLLDLARGYAPANTGIKKWSDAAPWVARGGPTATQAVQLQGQESIYRKLHDEDLTPILKNDRAPLRPDLEAIYARFLGFLFTVLGLIDLRDGA